MSSSITVSDFIADREMRRLSVHSIRHYRLYCNQWTAFLESAPAGEDVTATFRRWISTKGPVTGFSAFRDIRALEFWREEVTEKRSWIRRCRRWKFDPPPTPQPLSEQEYFRIICQLKRTIPVDRRDRVVYSILWECGARLGAVVALRRADVDLQNKILRVHTKGNIFAPIVLLDKCAEILGRWMRENPTASPWLFPSPRDDSKHLSMSYVTHKFKRLAREAGITRRVWVHLLRHSFATRMLNRGVSLTSIQRQLCHTSPIMTMRYARTNLDTVDREMRAAG